MTSFLSYLCMCYRNQTQVVRLECVMYFYLTHPIPGPHLFLRQFFYLFYLVTFYSFKLKCSCMCLHRSLCRCLWSSEVGVGFIDGCKFCDVCGRNTRLALNLQPHSHLSASASLLGGIKRCVLPHHDFCGCFCLHVWLYTICIPDAHGSQKRVSGTLELDLQIVVSHYVGADYLKVQPLFLMTKLFFQLMLSQFLTFNRPVKFLVKLCFVPELCMHSAFLALVWIPQYRVNWTSCIS